MSGDYIDFIPEMKQEILDRYPVLPLWADLLSCTTLSSVISKDTFFHNKYGDNRMNHWVSFFAPSGDFKSAPIDEVVVPMIRYVGKRTERYFILPSIASTVEGMIKYFGQIEEDKRVGLIVRDELTTFFKESQYKDYLTDEMEIYSKMYDGKIYPRETMQFSTKDVMEVCTSLVGATTPKYLYDVMPLQFFFQGCGNRFCYVRQDAPTKGKYTDEDLFVHEPPKWSKEHTLSEDLVRLCGPLIKASQTRYTIVIDVNAEKISTEFRNKREELKRSIPEDSWDSFKREYISRDWQKSLKFAQSHCYSRDFLRPAYEKASTIMLLPEDIEWGQNIVLQCYDHFEKVVKEWRDHVITERPKSTINRNINAVYALGIVKSFKEVSQTRLGLEIGDSNFGPKFYGAIRPLLEAGCISKIEDSNYVRLKGIDWMNEMMIDPNFSRPPVIYKFEKKLP